MPWKWRQGKLLEVAYFQTWDKNFGNAVDRSVWGLNHFSLRSLLYFNPNNGKISCLPDLVNPDIVRLLPRLDQMDLSM